jgi:hypothetical protein
MRKPATKTTIPFELRRKVSQSLLMFTGGSGIFFRILLIGTAAFGLYAASNHNAIWFLVGALICPSAVAILYTLIPLRPYRGDFYAKDMHEVDASDPAVMRLVALLKSTEARRHIWRQAVKLSGILFVIAWGATILLWGPVRWSFSLSSSRYWGFLLALCLPSCFGALGADHTDWGLTTWASREVHHQPASE